MPELYGYLTSSGYMGRVSNDCWILFDTEGQYVEYMKGAME